MAPGPDVALVAAIDIRDQVTIILGALYPAKNSRLTTEEIRLAIGGAAVQLVEISDNLTAWGRANGAKPVAIRLSELILH